MDEQFPPGQHGRDIAVRRAAQILTAWGDRPQPDNLSEAVKVFDEMDDVDDQEWRDLVCAMAFVANLLADHERQGGDRTAWLTRITEKAVWRSSWPDTD
ncbi:hypothetical protein ACIBG8_14640 [Nonomuraea sp. NPDC050556]|uniref:hypothetical protein n=1 Tax=Nonomuraea sp. NPDC050556 TaxID=3364369 RepID=UPI00378E2127